MKRRPTSQPLLDHALDVNQGTRTLLSDLLKQRAHHPRQDLYHNRTYMHRYHSGIVLKSSVTTLAAYYIVGRATLTRPSRQGTGMQR